MLPRVHLYLKLLWCAGTDHNRSRTRALRRSSGSFGSMEGTRSINTRGGGPGAEGEGVNARPRLSRLLVQVSVHR